VRPDLNGRGIGDALEREVFRECARRGLSLVRATLSFEHVSEERLRGVSARILETGWWFSSRIVYKPLHPAQPVQPAGQQEEH
jgi:GNAT superfamily N-acetyltransferase